MTRNYEAENIVLMKAIADKDTEIARLNNSIKGIEEDNERLRKSNKEYREQKNFRWTRANIILTFVAAIVTISVTAIVTLWVANKPPAQPNPETSSQTTTTLATPSTTLRDGQYDEGIKIDGGTYYGPIKNGKRHGNGKFVYEHKDSDCTYEGDWVDDKRTGQGSLREVNKKTGVVYQYTGGWLNNKYHGYGRVEFNPGKNPGDWYEGDWKESKRDGKGTNYYSNSGDKYEGDWKDDKRHGIGIYYNKEYNTYTKGEWAYDKSIRRIS